MKPMKPRNNKKCNNIISASSYIIELYYLSIFKEFIQCNLVIFQILNLKLPLKKTVHGKGFHWNGAYFPSLRSAHSFRLIFAAPVLYVLVHIVV